MGVDNVEDTVIASAFKVDETGKYNTTIGVVGCEELALARRRRSPICDS